MDPLPERPASLAARPDLTDDVAPVNDDGVQLAAMTEQASTEQPAVRSETTRGESTVFNSVETVQGVDARNNESEPTRGVGLPDDSATIVFSTSASLPDRSAPPRTPERTHDTGQPRRNRAGHATLVDALNPLRKRWFRHAKSHDERHTRDPAASPSSEPSAATVRTFASEAATRFVSIPSEEEALREKEQEEQAQQAKQAKQAEQEEQAEQAKQAEPTGGNEDSSPESPSDPSDSEKLGAWGGGAAGVEPVSSCSDLISATLPHHGISETSAPSDLDGQHAGAPGTVTSAHSEAAPDETVAESGTLPGSNHLALPRNGHVHRNGQNHRTHPSIDAAASSGTRSPIPTASRVQLQFPAALENALQAIDDAFIPPIQRKWQSPRVHALVLAITTVTAIESGLPFPCALYALGYDTAAGLATSVLLVLAFASQIPKKFIFRARPWMSGRAIPYRKDRTSSFPSRAVVCAVVFSWVVAECIDRESQAKWLPSAVRWVLLAAIAAWAAFARICVGAHYFSDTVGGFILGVVVVRTGNALDAAWVRRGCATSAADIARVAVTLQPGVTANEGKEAIITSIRGALSKHLSLRLTGCVVLAYIFTVASIQGFWVKCSYVYGLLMSAATFRHVYLCAGATGVRVENVVDTMSSRQYLAVGSLFGSLLAFGMVFRGRKGVMRIITFTVIYFGALGGMLYWRLVIPSVANARNVMQTTPDNASTIE